MQNEKAEISLNAKTEVNYTRDGMIVSCAMPCLSWLINYERDKK
jgi:hypothetical protein